MPYVKQNIRAVLDGGCEPHFAGELNYVITQQVRRYLGQKPDYARINEAVGVLECAKLELYRRIAAPFENAKIEENGDVY